MADVNGPELFVPLVETEPLQPPEAVHEVAFVELHVSVDAPPLATVVGFAVNVAVGAGSLVTGGASPDEPPPPHAASSNEAPIENEFETRMAPLLFF